MYEIQQPSIFREKVIKNINFIIMKMWLEFFPQISSEVKLRCFNNLSINIEKGIYNYTIKESTNRKIIKKWDNRYFTQIYCDRLKTVIVNIKTTPELVRKLVENDISPNIFAYMTHQEMRPDQWNDLITIKIKRDESKYVNRVEASTDIYQCRKCKSRKCTYYSAQIRSADEPMTVFISCLDCGQNWKN